MPERELNIRVICRWDAEPKVWWAESEDLPGLVTEASTMPELIQRIMDVAPELIEDNLDTGSEAHEILLNLIPVYQQTVRIPAR
jgi:predicted RNase H-like HicB family nuclease